MKNLNKILIVFLTILLSCGKDKESSNAVNPQAPQIEPLNLSVCKDTVDLLVSLDLQGAGQGSLLSLVLEVGYYSDQYNDRYIISPEVRSFTLKDQPRGQKYFISGLATSVSEEFFAKEVSLEVLTCEELRKKIDAGESVQDEHQVTVKW